MNNNKMKKLLNSISSKTRQVGLGDVVVDEVLKDMPKVLTHYVTRAEATEGETLVFDIADKPFNNAVVVSGRVERTREDFEANITPSVLYRELSEDYTRIVFGYSDMLECDQIIIQYVLGD